MTGDPERYRNIFFLSQTETVEQAAVVILTGEGMTGNTVVRLSPLYNVDFARDNGSSLDVGGIRHINVGRTRTDRCRLPYIVP